MKEPIARATGSFPLRQRCVRLTPLTIVPAIRPVIVCVALLRSMRKILPIVAIADMVVETAVVTACEMVVEAMVVAVAVVGHDVGSRLM